MCKHSVHGLPWLAHLVPEEAFAWHFMLFVRSDSKEPVICNFLDQLLIYVILVHFDGSSGPQLKICVDTWVTSIMAHLIDNITWTINPHRPVCKPRLLTELLPWL